jgi:FMN phosphatase YigB (HAD superfamily)
MDAVGLLFDADDVLYDATVWRHWLVQLLSRLGIHTSYQAFCHLWERSFLVEAHCGRCDYGDALRGLLTSIGLARGQIDEVLAAASARRRQLDETVRALPGVARTLERLQHRGVRLGVVANDDAGRANLAQRLRRAGLNVEWRAIATSYDVRCAMPDAPVYRAALAEMELSAEQAVLVSHDRLELAGAAAVGMHTIAVNYDGDVAADVHVARFDQLPAIVDRLRVPAMAI